MATVSPQLNVRHSKYTFNFKMSVLLEDERSSLSRNVLAKKHNISPKLIRDWSKKKGEIEEAYQRQGGGGKHRVSGGGRKPLFPEIDAKVLTFYKNCREKKLRVSRKRLKLYAKQVHRT